QHALAIVNFERSSKSMMGEQRRNRAMWFGCLDKDNLRTGQHSLKASQYWQFMAFHINLDDIRLDRTLATEVIPFDDLDRHDRSSHSLIGDQAVDRAPRHIIELQDTVLVRECGGNGCYPFL